MFKPFAATANLLSPSDPDDPFTSEQDDPSSSSSVPTDVAPSYSLAPFNGSPGFALSYLPAWSASHPAHKEAPSASGDSPTAAVSGSGAASGGSAPVASSGSSTNYSGTTHTVATAGSGLEFVNTYSSSCTAAFIACIVAAEKQLESLFTNSLTVTATFVMAPTDPTKKNPNPFALSNNPTGGTDNYSYAQLKTALLKKAPGDVLPSSDPSGGAGFTISDAYARFLGLSSSTATTDVTVTLNTYYTWDFKQDVINGLTHEISENGLGRVSGLGDQNSEWSTMDLFRYTSAGVYDTTDGRDGKTTYFSSDGGDTTSESAGLSFYNEYSGSKYLSNGDPDDWNQQQVFGSTSQGETLTLNQTELNVMKTLGWKVANPQDIMETSGDWLTTTDWSGGYSPITVEDAFIGVLNAVAGTIGANNYPTNVTVNSIGTNTISSLEIKNGSSLTATNGTALASNITFTWASGNLGALKVDVGATLTIGDKFDNEGSLTIGRITGSADINNGGYLDLTGTVKLNGATGTAGSGLVYLGQHSSTYSGYSYGDISGGGLVNVNNTIDGAGVVTLDTLDNQAGGTINANQGSYYLELEISSTFTNEGEINAAADSTLQLGKDGGTESLTETGATTIQGGADLALAGNYTISGGGSIDFKGAGAKIVSDGKAATFHNDSTINADTSGRIGDSNLTFDNAGKVYASGAGVTLTINTGSNVVTNAEVSLLQAEDDAILSLTSNVDNQGVINAGSSSSTGTVQVGQDGGAGSMTNDEAVQVFAQSDLAIRGNYAIGGSGAVYLKGAGSGITSDGKAATLTNNGDIVGEGQIGDEGVLSSNDLTLDNEGAIDAAVSGVKLKLDTGSNTIENNSVLEATGGGLLVILSEVANIGTISAGGTTPGTSSVTSGTVELGQSGVTNVMENSGGIGIYAGSDLAIRGNYTIEGSAQIDFKGAGAEITSDGGAPATFVNDTVIYAGFSGQIGDTGIETTNDLTFDNNGTVLATGAGVTVKLKTGDDTIEDGNGTLEAKSGATLAIRSDVDTGSTGADGGTIVADTGSTVSLTTTVSDNISGPSSTGEVNIAGGTFEMLAGSSVTVPVVFTDGGTLEETGVTTTVNVSGSGGTIDLSDGSKVAVTGGPDTIDFLSGAGNVAKLYNTGANTDTVSGSNGKVVLSAANISLSGSDDLIKAGDENNVAVTSGANDTLDIGFSDNITDGGSTTLFSIDDNVGTLTIHNFAADPTGIIDFLSGVGGFVNRADALAQITSDGHGGSILSLAATGDGSIELLNVLPTSLSKSNFMIG